MKTVPLPGGQKDRLLRHLGHPDVLEGIPVTPTPTPGGRGALGTCVMLTPRTDVQDSRFVVISPASSCGFSVSGTLDRTGLPSEWGVGDREELKSQPSIILGRERSLRLHFSQARATLLSPAACAFVPGETLQSEIGWKQ